MSCWEFLGLEAGSDERSIKRRYSQLLKVHRPDEDPAAFQRLREAYEQAVSFARWSQASMAEPDPSDVPDGDADVVAPVARELAVVSQVAGQATELLIDPDIENLDAALASAEAQGLRERFERRLLEKSLADSTQGLHMARWALSRLNWLTPWQSPALPATQQAELAERLLKESLRAVGGALENAEERSALEQLKALAQSAWLQSFDQRAWFHQRLVDWLLQREDWSAAFFDRLCLALGWSDADEQQPCSPYQWQALKDRCEGYAMLLRLRKHLAEIWPVRAEEKAAWLLLKPLSDVHRRRLVDSFVEQDWQACRQLSDALEYRFPDLAEQLSESGLYDWRRWAPGEAWASAYRWLWVLLFLTLLVAMATSGKVANAAESGASALVVEYVVTSLLCGAMVTVVLSVLTFVHRGWRHVCIWLSGPDAALSRVLLPGAWTRRGSGLTLLRHVLPSALIGALVWLWNAPFGAAAPAIGVAAAVACLSFADFATRGGSMRQLRLAVAARVRLPWRKIGVAIFVVFCVTLMAALVHKNLGRMQPAARPGCAAETGAAESLRELCTLLNKPHSQQATQRYMDEAGIE